MTVSVSNFTSPFAKGLYAGFLVGSAVIGGGSYLYLKKKSDEEIQSVIKEFNEEINKTPDPDEFKKQAEAFKKHVKKLDEENSEEVEVVEETEFSEYKSRIEEYAEEPGHDSLTRKEEPLTDIEGQVITEEEFGENSTYEQFSLEYYPETMQLFDASDNSEITQDDEIIDFDVFKAFGSGDLNDPDCIYYRNNDKNMDLEIIRILGTP